MAMLLMLFFKGASLYISSASLHDQPLSTYFRYNLLHLQYAPNTIFVTQDKYIDK